MIVETARNIKLARLVEILNRKEVFEYASDVYNQF